MATPPKVQILRTDVADRQPTALLPGELAVEMASIPPKLWVGVPTAVNPAGIVLLNSDSGGSGTGGYTQAESDAKFVDAAGDSMSGPLLLPAGPTLDQHASTKKYVDDKVAAGIGTAPATALEYISNSAPTKMLTPGAVWSAAGVVTLIDAASVAPNFAAGIDFIWAIGAAGRTLANPTGLKIGQKGVIYLVQPAAGAMTITTWGSFYKFPGGIKPSLSETANAVDDISYVVKSATEVHCFFTPAMA
jgi:hypothetical protein